MADSISSSLLVAMPQLGDPNFRRSVVQLVHHDAEGAFGLVVNRKSELTAREICADHDIQWAGRDPGAVGFGGPVQQETGWLLLGEDGPDELAGASPIADGIRFAPATLDALRCLAPSPPQPLRLYLGYAGWGPGQLEAELEQDSWIVEPALPGDVFVADADGLWSDVLRRKGGPYAVLALMPPDPSLN
jgi:putative transcriptional regulator